VSVKVTSDYPVAPEVPSFLKQAIQQTLARTDPRLRISPSGDTVIVCTITDLRITNGIERRTRSEYRKTGEMTVTDPMTGMTRTEDQYGYVDVPYRALVLDARMSIRCEVVEAATGVVLYSDRFDPLLTDARDAAFGATTEDQNAIYMRLAQSAAGSILTQLCPGDYRELAELPAGKLKDASTLLEQGHWPEALRLLTSMQPLKKPADDAYRLYSIGVALEALSYESSNMADARLEIERALENYQRAAELKPREQIFWVAKNRAEASLIRVNQVLAQAQALEDARKTGAGSGDLFHQVMSTTPAGPSVVTNDTVVQWVRSGYSEDYVKSSIRHAPRTSFDLSDAGRLSMERQGVSKAVVKVMVEKQRPPSYGLGMRKMVVYAVATMAVSLLPMLFSR
jgi:hypothetical protein